jgi:hypothetical protein
MNSNIFSRLSDLVVRSNARRLAEHEDFLRIYRQIVETVPTEVAEAFGNLNNIPLVRGSETESVGIELNVKDYLWWDRKVKDGWRIKLGPDLLLSQMAERMAEKAEAGGPRTRRTQGTAFPAAGRTVRDSQTDEWAMLRKRIEERIAHLSRDDSQKSDFDSLSDRRIVQELQSIRDFMDAIA